MRAAGARAGGRAGAGREGAQAASLARRVLRELSGAKGPSGEAMSATSTGGTTGGLRAATRAPTSGSPARNPSGAPSTRRKAEDLVSPRYAHKGCNTIAKLRPPRREAPVVRVTKPASTWPSRAHRWFTKFFCAFMRVLGAPLALPTGEPEAGPRARTTWHGAPRVSRPPVCCPGTPGCRCSAGPPPRRARPRRGPRPRGGSCCSPYLCARRARRPPLPTPHWANINLQPAPLPTCFPRARSAARSSLERRITHDLKFPAYLSFRGASQPRYKNIRALPLDFVWRPARNCS